MDETPQGVLDNLKYRNYVKKVNSNVVAGRSRQFTFNAQRVYQYPPSKVFVGKDR